MTRNYLYTIFFLLLIFSSLILAGCRTIRPPSTYKDTWTPTKYVLKKEVYKEDPWAEIEKRSPNLDTPLSLGDLLEISLQNSPDTKKAWYDTLKTSYQMKEAYSDYYPQVTLEATAKREKDITKSQDITDPLNKKKKNIIDDHSLYGPSAELSLLLLDFGGRKAEKDKEVYALIAQNFIFNQSIQDLVLDVESAYYNLYSGYAFLDAAYANKRDAEESYELAKAKYNTGLASKLDLYQSKADLENSLYSLENAKGELNIKKGKMAQVVGLRSDKNLQVDFPEKITVENINEENVSDLIGKALKLRPEIRALRAQAQSTREEIASAFSNMLPNLNFGASAESSWYHYHPDASANVYQRNDRVQEYAGYFTVNWDIFDGFYHINKKHEAEQNYASIKSELESTELSLTQEVWTEYNSYVTSMKKLEYAEAYLQSAQISFELGLESYKEGIKSMVDLLDAQSQLQNARSSLVSSERDLFLAAIELSHATGSLYPEQEIEQNR